MTKNSRGGHASLILALIVGLIVSMLPSFVGAPAANAADARNFDPGYIVSDSVFYNSDSMTADDIQQFLNSRVATCRSRGVPCLKNYSQATDNRPADRYCNGYQGQGNESAAQIIDKVARSCGISQQTLLVLLEKEQGLVSSSSPSSWSYSAATGFGCPDTAPCDSSMAGFFYQVYYGARQFQVYRASPANWGYQAGRNNNILFNPNYACGTQRVYIQNQATAALYIYTPYTPNQAALDNLYGSGDSCSAYGNRNFWRIFTDWFGNPAGNPVIGEYAKVWAAIGGGTGLLGNPTGVEECNGRYCQQTFRGGTIFWFPGYPVVAVPSLVEGIWRNLGFIDGAAGYPTGVVVCDAAGACTQSFTGGVIAADGGGGSLVGRTLESAWISAGGIKLGGARGPAVCSQGSQCAQMFARGALFSGGTASFVSGDIFAAWTVAGLTSGAAGYPSANAVCTLLGCTQRFGGGLIVSATSGASFVPQALATKYLASGGLSGPGGPVTQPSCDNSGNCSQRFTNARLDSTPHGVFATTSWFLSAWADTGFEQGRLGRPTSEMTCVPATCYQAFEGGTLSGSPSGAVIAVYGSYRDVWNGSGGPGGALGLPVSAETCNGHDCSLSFQNGTVVWTPSSGALLVSGRLLTTWEGLNSGLGRLGGPTAPAACTGNSCSQAFEGGTLTTAPSGAIVPIYGAYRTTWASYGGATGSLGLPMAAETCNGHDCSQTFQGGVVVWTPVAGAVAVTSWFLSPWLSQGSGLGRLGAPTAATVCVPATCYQAFEGGTLSGSPSSGILPVFGAYRDVWAVAGGPAGALGLPVRPEICRGSYCSTDFERGTVIWAPSSGAIAVSAPIFDVWRGAGGAGGTYGLPVGAAVSAGGTVTQQFQRGSVSAAG